MNTLNNYNNSSNISNIVIVLDKMILVNLDFEGCEDGNLMRLCITNFFPYIPYVCKKQTNKNK